jgi:hypothetical protein
MVPGNNVGQPRRNLPCSLQRNCQHLFLTLLSREPFTDAFYYSSFLPNGIRPPNGLKQVKVTNALARLNTIEFHDRNGTVGRLWTEVTMEATRLRLFNEYFQEHHGTLDEDCQQVIQVILNAHNAIRAVDQDNHVAQEHANEAR